MDFVFWDWVYYKDNAGYGVNKIGKFLGVASNVGNSMCYHILTGDSVKVISRSTVARVPIADFNKTEVKATIDHHTANINEKLNAANHVLNEDEDGKEMTTSETRKFTFAADDEQISFQWAPKWSFWGASNDPTSVICSQ